MNWIEAFQRKQRVRHNIEDAKRMFPLEPTRSLAAEIGMSPKALLDHIREASNYPLDTPQWNLACDALHTVNSYLGMANMATTVLGLNPERLQGLESKLGKLKQLDDFLSTNPSAVWNLPAFNLWTTDGKISED